MVAVEHVGFVFVAGLVSAVTTGLGAIPFFVVEDVDARWTVRLWGLASGIMLVASLGGLVTEGLARGTTMQVGVGLACGAVLVVIADRALGSYEPEPEQYETATYRELLLILGVLTVHSFPEGVAVGVSYADLGLIGGVDIAGLSVPLLAVFMTVAIAVHNVPEGLALAIPLQALGVPNWRLFWWGVFSSLPQPLGAALAFYFVRIAREFLAYGFGFAAGAMIYLVITEFVPEALEAGAELPSGGVRGFLTGLILGALLMAPITFV